MCFVARLALPLGLSLLSVALPAWAAPPVKPGFPYNYAGVGWARQSRPVLADLGLPAGKKCVVFGTSGQLPAGSPGGVPTSGGWLFVVRQDGTTAPGFPVQLGAEVNTPAIGDLNGDGRGEVILVGYGGVFNGLTVPGGLRAFNVNGSVRWNKPGRDFPPPDGVAESVYSTPAIADVDGDGKPEAAWGGYDGWVYLVDLDTGADKPGWPVFIKDSIWSSPALHDVNGDGKLEVIIGVDSHGGGEVVLGHPTPDGGCLWVFRPDATVEPGFPYCVSMVIWSSPAVGDINGDGKPDIVFGTGNCTVANGCAPGPGYTYTHRLYAVSSTGGNLAGWPVSLEANEEALSSPALGDLDGNGIPEVVQSTIPTGTGAKSAVYIFKGDGTRVRRTVPTTSDGVPRSDFTAGDPVIADVAGDSKPEILVPYNWEVCVLDGTGTQLTQSGGLQMSTWGPVGSVAAGNMEADGSAVEVVVASSGHFNFIDVNETAVTIWNPKVAVGDPPWGLFRQGERRLGVYPGTPAGSVIPAPVVSAVAPPSGSTAGGTAVTISGAAFASGAAVTFGGPSATNVTFVDASTITATTPPHAAGVVTVTVTNPDTRAGSLVNGFTFVAPPIGVTGVNPRVGRSSGGTAISISGTSFAPNATVTVGGALSSSTVVVSGTSISTVTPAGAIGPADVVVTNPGGGNATLPGGFTYTATGLPPRFNAITPCRVVDTRGPAGPFGAPALQPLATRSFAIPSGPCPVPADAAALSLNVTVADATSAGTLTMYPGSGSAPGTNTISFVPGKNRANNVVIGLVGGVVSVRNTQTSGKVQFIVDVNGYFR